MTEHRVFRPVEVRTARIAGATRRAHLPQPDALDFQCVHPRCGKKPQTRYEFPLPLCNDHLVKTLTAALEVTRAAKRAYGEANADKKMPFPARMKIPTGNYVYYVRFGDRIKIGTTGNLTARLASLPYDEILALEPGSVELERERHQQFAESLVAGREWFSPSKALMDHIASLKKR